ncbi:hypothetical protein lbkm_1186 [Lachnospiraceae bacterium KM106-2]|nr:hypothetical protein lbkm_1186 [Lachnospiraceae bacterium KM106-2]
MRIMTTSQKKRKIIVILVVLLLVIIGLFSYRYIKAHHDFRKSIKVITKNDSSDQISYYEVNSAGVHRKIKSFQSDPIQIYHVTDCYHSDIVSGKVKNLLTLDKAIKTDINDKDVLTELSDIDHEIMKTKMININNETYVVVLLNVNLWSPYCLYHYDQKKKCLKEIKTFDGEDVIGIKLK